VEATVPVTVVVGGQYGSEGKGKICAHLAVVEDIDVMVRCGGPNAGHTVDFGTEKYELKQVPAGFVNPRTRLLIAAGALIDIDLLLGELQRCQIDHRRFGIDQNAGIIEPEDHQTEVSEALRQRVGSTGMGVGAATSRRVLREQTFRRAAEVPELAPFITCVRHEVQLASQDGKRVVIEGTQGFGLSLYHTPQWPYCTSRETTAQSFLGEVGVGVREFAVVLAIRTFPIRVGGNSGPLPNEITWDKVRKQSNYPHEIAEYTTTTKRLRRVALFDWEVVLDAVAANAPTFLALHGADYLNYQNKSAREYSALSYDSKTFIAELEERTSVRVGLIGTGPLQGEIIDRRAILGVDNVASHALNGRARLQPVL
jgi:adenylosuccinate synthase